MFFKKIQLIPNSFFEVLAKINIEVVDGVVDDFCKLPQMFLGFFNDFHRK